MIPTLAAFRHSLAGRLLIALGAALALGLAAMFFGIDHYVSSRFSRLRAEQIDRSREEVRRFIVAEGERLQSFAELLAQDADLRNSAFYHLYLAGERDHPQGAISRIAEAFAFASVSLWDGHGRLIAAAPTVPPGGAAEIASANNRLLATDDRAWLIAEAPVRREGEPIAQLRLAQPLEKVLANGLPALYPAALRLARADEIPQKGERIDLGTASLILDLPDPVGAALAEAKRVLAVILVGGGILLGLFLAWQLRRQTKPLAELAAAVSVVGRGDFSPRVAIVGAREISELAVAFNRMAEDLALLRQREKQRAHQEQLSAIGRVAARVAHDINNPLTVISNTARLALKTPPTDARLAEDLRRIVHHSERCMRTLELLLDYGRPVRLTLVAVDLAALLQEIGARWRAEAQPLTPCAIRADPLHLEQLFDNLLANARDAAGPAGHIRISSFRREGWVEIAVEDDGPGFAPEVRAHLFEPFFTNKRGGTGLGLASALAIARAHGGDIEIGEGPGGRVFVRLPLSLPVTP